MSDTTTGDWLVCPMCKQIIPYGTPHACGVGPPQYFVSTNMDAEILGRLDKIIALLEKLTK